MQTRLNKSRLYWAGQWHDVSEKAWAELTKLGLIREMVDPQGDYYSLQSAAGFELLNKLEARELDRALTEANNEARLAGSQSPWP